MYYDNRRVENARQLVSTMSSAELAQLVVVLSSDVDTELYSTMNTMMWLFNTAPCNRLDPVHTTYREQAWKAVGSP